MQDRIMIFHPSETNRFVRIFCDRPFQWTGENIGDVTNFLNPVPAIKGNKLFYLNPTNQYVILKKYETLTHIIELIKRIYEMYIIPYNICTYKNKLYIMYCYTPLNEMEYSINKKKKDEITETERKIFFFHWMLGVKGKTVKIYNYDVTCGYNGTYIIVSNSKYSSIDYERNKLSDSAAKRFFGDYHILYNIAMFFNDETKLSAVRELINDDNYWWFQEIERRIKQHVKITA